MKKKVKQDDTGGERQSHFWPGCNTPCRDTCSKRKIIRGFDGIANEVASQDLPKADSICFRKWKVEVASHNNFKGLQGHFMRTTSHQSRELNTNEFRQKKYQIISEFNRSQLQRHRKNQSAELNYYIEQKARSHVQKVERAMNVILQQSIFN